MKKSFTPYKKKWELENLIFSMSHVKTSCFMILTQVCLTSIHLPKTHTQIHPSVNTGTKELWQELNWILLGNNKNWSNIFYERTRPPNQILFQSPGSTSRSMGCLPFLNFDSFFFLWSKPLILALNHIFPCYFDVLDVSILCSYLYFKSKF